MAPESAHCMSGSMPDGTFVQVPALPDSPHDLQFPVQAVEQQTPCAQKLELHSTSLPQVAPTGFLPQLPWLQVLGAMQSVSAMHVVLHCPLALHWNGAHDVLVAPMQAPTPSQRPADRRFEPAHPESWQIVPAAYF
jgi:hypothetical protein